MTTSLSEEFTLDDFKGIQVKDSWNAFDVLVAVCAQLKKKMKKNKSAQDFPFFLSKKKRSRRETEKKKEPGSEEQERPIKKIRFFSHPQEAQKEEIIRKKVIIKPASVLRPVQIPGGNRKKDLKEKLVRLLAVKHDLSDEFRQKIKDMNKTGDAQLVIQKMLYRTDTKQDQNRFSMPLNQLCCSDFLTENEKMHIEKRTKDNHLETIDVRVIEPGLNVREAKFTKWDFNKANGKPGSKSYVIIGAWTDIRTRNKLEPGMFMQSWSFRVEDILCFALVKLPIRLELD